MPMHLVTALLSADPFAPGRARDVVIAALSKTGLVNAKECAALLVSEVVTNAVMHAKSDAAVVLTMTDEHVRVSVTDYGPGWPELRKADGSAGGHGLRLVEAMAKNWGVYRIGEGKTVWFELPAS